MKPSHTPIIQHIPKFLEYCAVEKGLSSASVRNYENFLKPFAQWCVDHGHAHLKPQELSPDHVWDYRLYLSRKRDVKGRVIKKTTQNYYLIALRNILKYFTDKDITALPAEKIKLPKLTDQDKAIKFLRFEHVEKLMAMPNVATVQGQRDRAILEILFSTGMRVTELTSLNVKQFDLRALSRGTLKEYELPISGKGGRTRTIYFSGRALHWLGKYLATRKDLSPALFIHYRPDKKANERRLTARSVERLIKRYTHMAGLPVDATPHTLRHSFATDLLDQGADLRSVQELLGHKNIATTQIYTHLTNPQLRQVHRRFHRGHQGK